MDRPYESCSLNSSNACMQPAHKSLHPHQAEGRCASVAVPATPACWPKPCVVLAKSRPRLSSWHARSILISIRTGCQEGSILFVLIMRARRLRQCLSRKHLTDALVGREMLSCKYACSSSCIPTLSEARHVGNGVGMGTCTFKYAFRSVCVKRMFHSHAIMGMRARAHISMHVCFMYV